MILESGMKVLVTHRRLFESDHPRYFAGVVEGYENGLARVTGHTWTRDGYRGVFLRKQDARTKILAIGSGTMIVYQLPSTVQLEDFRIETEGARSYAHDASGFRMDLSEGHLHYAPVSSQG
jgi:hypothetical protein